MRITSYFVGIILAIGAPFSGASASASEEPTYAVLKRTEVFEVRKYQPYIVAEVVVLGPADKAGDQSFSLLGGYIFGKNKGKAKIDMTAPVMQAAAPVKIDMTAPVTQAATANGFLVQFMMPANWTLATLPEPLEPSIKLREVPAMTYAVIQYSGSWSQANYDAHLDKLRTAVKNASLITEGEPVFSRYNAPFVPTFMRRNEIWLRVV